MRLIVARDASPPLKLTSPTVIDRYMLQSSNINRMKVSRADVEMLLVTSS